MSLHDTLVYINTTVDSLSAHFNRLPGSAIIIRYVKSSYQHDPVRSALELCLFLFALRYFFASKYSFSKKDFVKLTDGEIDELVDDWNPEPLVEELTPEEEVDIEKVPVIVGAAGPKVKLASGKSAFNLASYDVLNMSAVESVKDVAAKTIYSNGVGACGPTGFYGYQDKHITLEQDIARFLGTESSIVYAQAFNTIQSVIPSFCKRGDIIVADKRVTMAIQKGIQISRSTVRWFEHNDMEDLERVLQKVVKDFAGVKPLTRRIIITEGIFESEGDMADLPRIIELKHKYKFRVILEESCSVGVVGKHGRGLCEHFNIPPTEVDMIVGSLANGFGAGGGYCASHAFAVEHQRISSAANTFSAALPAYLAASASEAIAVMESQPDRFVQLGNNVRVLRGILDRSTYMYSTSSPDSPFVTLRVRPDVLASRRIDDLEHTLQDIVDECLANGVLVTRLKYVASQEVFPPVPAIKIAVSGALSKKEIEKAGSVIKAAATKVLSKAPKAKN
ncbi:pyridoxal phosphate-dependent transferase [Dipodascopsis tothii]|uniref:pyridoxal phosphate-dependent transferase n=1 Tax=Dipodascopsis tothii TaxID=44089 RepID=UPI0034CF7384